VQCALIIAAFADSGGFYGEGFGGKHVTTSASASVLPARFGIAAVDD
jgi:hypothetical protein